MPTVPSRGIQSSSSGIILLGEMVVGGRFGSPLEGGLPLVGIGIFMMDVGKCSCGGEAGPWTTMTKQSEQGEEGSRS